MNSTIYLLIGVVLTLGILFFFLMRSADKHLQTPKTKVRRKSVRSNANKGNA